MTLYPGLLESLRAELRELERRVGALESPRDGLYRVNPACAEAFHEHMKAKPTDALRNIMHSPERVEAAELHIPERDDRNGLASGAYYQPISAIGRTLPEYHAAMEKTSAAPPPAASPLSTGPDRRDTPATDTPPVDPAAVSPSTSPGAEGSQAPVLRDGSVHSSECWSILNDCEWCDCSAVLGHKDCCAIAHGFEKCDCIPSVAVPSVQLNARVALKVTGNPKFGTVTALGSDGKVKVQIDAAGSVWREPGEIVVLPEGF